MLYNTRHIAELLNIAPSTVKKYCGMYGRFLSADARPEKGSHRLFNADDLKVFSLIVERHKSGISHDDIILALDNGQRGELPAAHFEYTLTASAREQVAMLTLRVNQLDAEILRLNGEITRLGDELRTAHESDQRRAGQVEILSRQLESAQKEIRELYKQIGRLEARGDIG